MRVALNAVAHPVQASPGPEAGSPAEGVQGFGAVLRAHRLAPPPSTASVGGPLKSPKRTELPADLVDVITRLRRDERRLDRHLKRALAGHQLDMPQLVALQSLAFKYSQRVELLGKLVDRLTGAVKQTLQMQI